MRHPLDFGQVNNLEFTRADKPIGLTPALAAEGGISQFFPELFTFSAARSGLGKSQQQRQGLQARTQPPPFAL